MIWYSGYAAIFINVRPTGPSAFFTLSSLPVGVADYASTTRILNDSVVHAPSCRPSILGNTKARSLYIAPVFDQPYHAFRPPNATPHTELRSQTENDPP